MGPSADGEGSAGVLGLDRICVMKWSAIEEGGGWSIQRSRNGRSGALPTSNIPEFPIFKEQEMLPSRYLLQAFDCFLRPVVYDIGVGLEYAYVVTDFFCDAQKVVCGMNISGYAEVGALYGDQGEKVCG